MTPPSLMTLTVEVWRQAGPDTQGAFETHTVTDVAPELSLLELLDHLNADLVDKGIEPIVFDHDCREGVCGSCGVLVDGVPHGPKMNTPTCQQHLRSFADGDHVRLEPMHARGFEVIRDLVVDRSPLDRIIAAGGHVATPVSGAPEANAIPIGKAVAEQAMDHAACIGCGACVAACPNASAHLFVGAKVSQLALLPQGQPQRQKRVAAMTASADLDFGACSDVGACRDVCPAGVPLDAIARLNHERLRSILRRR